MNWRNIFKPADILTAADLAELEKIDKKATQHRALIERIRDEWPTANERIDALERLGQKLAEAPTDEALFHRCTMVAAMPQIPFTDTNTGTKLPRSFTERLRRFYTRRKRLCGEY